MPATPCSAEFKQVKELQFFALSLSAFAFLTVSLFFRVMHVKREGGHVRGDTIKGLDFGVGQPPSFSACTLPALTSIIRPTDIPSKRMKN